MPNVPLSSTRVQNQQRVEALYVGIDPGKSGGISAIDTSVGRLHTFKMPETEVDQLNFFREDLRSVGSGVPVYACVERVGGYVGGDGNTGSSMFTFGFAVGGIRMACLAAGIPLEEVHMSQWAKSLGISHRRKSETKSQWKKRLRAYAQQLYPTNRISLQTADSVLIAEYLLRKRQGDLS